MHFNKYQSIKILIVIVLSLIAVVVTGALEESMQSQTTIVTGIQELHGIQGADAAVSVAQKQQLRKKGPEGVNAAKLLDRIDRDKMKEFRIINGAMETQSSLYRALKDGKDAEAGTLVQKLKGQIPEAQQSLQRLRKLTDEQIRVMSGTTTGAQATRVAEATYSSWKAAVDSLKVDLLTEEEVRARNDILARSGYEAVTSAQAQVGGIDPGTLPDKDRNALRAVANDGNVVLDNLGSIISSGLEILARGLNMANDAMKHYNDMQKMQHDLTYGQGYFHERNNGGRSLRIMRMVVEHAQGFVGYYRPFLRVVGSKSGVAVGKGNPANETGGPVVGNGEFIEIANDAESRLLLKKSCTRWIGNQPGHEGEWQTALVREFTEPGARRFVDSLRGKHSDLASRIGNVRYYYQLLCINADENSYRVREHEFQNADKFEIFFLPIPNPSSKRIETGSVLEKVMNVCASLCPPERRHESGK